MMRMTEEESQQLRLKEQVLLPEILIADFLEAMSEPAIIQAMIKDLSHGAAQ